jgi:uncharacterized protein (DUF1800 family)
VAFSRELAEIRFGCGLSPVVAPVDRPEDLLDRLRGPDDMAAAYPIDTFETFRARLVERAEIRIASRDANDKKAERQKVRALNREAAAARDLWHAQTLLRWSGTNQGLRERLSAFWADHFTVRGKSPLMFLATSTYVEEAIRPNMTGRFADLLFATTTHPVMLHYLDQATSVGANSPVAGRNKRLNGLNENLAREVLELHTLGVEGRYSQGDVTELARLFTGLSFKADTGFVFRRDFAEPGAETVLGKTYGGDPATLAAIRDVLHDLATPPDTARHIARKLAVHFVSDTPDPDLVEHVAARFQATGGDLMAVYAALIDHPAAWNPALRNVKPPMDYVASACRALALRPGDVAALDKKGFGRTLLYPLAKMGQAYQRPGGPDGWPEEDAAWITPQAVSARLRWAVTAPQKVWPDLPDPRGFVDVALGSYADAPVRFAAQAAESRSDAIGLILSAPAFQRR